MSNFNKRNIVKNIKKIGLWIGGIIIFIIILAVILPSDPQKEETKNNIVVENTEVPTTVSDTVSIKDDSEVTTTIGDTIPVKTKSDSKTPVSQKAQQPENPVVQQNNPSTARCTIKNYLPDPNCTSGAIDPKVTQENINSTICVSGYTSTVRPSTSVTNKIKVEQMQAYGFTDSMSNYELDHFIPLELGGSPASVSNLFPEPYAEPYGARSKDKVENYLHKQVCNGSITLTVAQEEIKTNWVYYYNLYYSKNTTVTSPITTTTQTTIQSSGKFYTSSASNAKYYAPESCSYWKTWAKSNLRSFNSLEELLKAYPFRALSPQCK